VLFALSFHTGFGQNILSKKHYLGIQPSFLLEPYDTIKALEVNIAPFNYEYRFDNLTAIQFRSVVNYRFYKAGSGISQVGGTFVFHKYFMKWFDEDFWISPSLGGFTTYTYNNLDLIHTITLGVEGGVTFSFNEWFSLSTNLQPGINYYPTEYSRQFVDSESGFKSHFGVIVHLGVNF